MYSENILRKNFFIIICLVAFFFRFFLFLGLQPWENTAAERLVSPTFDSFDYHRLAISLIEKKSFESFDGFRIPGYPVILAFMYSIFGVKIWIVLFFQILLDVTTGILIYAIAKKLFSSKRIASLAFFLYAIDILPAILTLQVMTETVFTFLFVLAIYFFVRYFQEEAGAKGTASLFMFGFLLGISTLVRSTFKYLPWLLLPFFIFQKKQFFHKIKDIVAFLIIFYFVISFWQARNYFTYGSYSLATVDGIHILTNNVAFVKAKLEGKDVVTATQELSRGTENIQNPFEKSETLKRIAVDYIKQHPLAYGYYHARYGIVTMFLDTAVTNIFDTFGFRAKKESASHREEIMERAARVWRNMGKDYYLAPLLFAFQFVEYIFGVLGLFIIFKRNEKIFAFFSLVLFFNFFLVYGVAGLVRYRAPIVPVYLLLAAYGFFHGVLNKRKFSVTI